MKKLLFLAAGLVLFSGCGEYIQSKTYDVKTVDGKIIRLVCPEFDHGRSSLTFIYDGDCHLAPIK